MHDRHAMVVPADFRGIGGTTVRTVRVHETWARTERNPNPGVRPMTITDRDGNVTTAKVAPRRARSRPPFGGCATAPRCSPTAAVSPLRWTA
jgi:hypothetical protein